MDQCRSTPIETTWCQQLPKFSDQPGQQRSRRPGSVQPASVPQAHSLSPVRRLAISASNDSHSSNSTRTWFAWHFPRMISLPLRQSTFPYMPEWTVQRTSLAQPSSASLNRKVEEVPALYTSAPFINRHEWDAHVF